MSYEYTIPHEAKASALALDPMEAATLTAVYNSMVIIRDRQRRTGFDDLESIIKPDGSLQTPNDRLSEFTAQQIFADMVPGTPFNGEEGAKTAGHAHQKRVGYDPIDGTRAVAVGAPTSTVIATVYNPDNSVYGAMIGEPATGRVFSAFNGGSTYGRIMDLATSETVRMSRAIHTWRGELEDKGQVFIDNNRPHRHLGHATLLGPQHDRLRSILRQQDIGVMEHGSNGAHQLYIASGGDRAAAAITTSRGNPEDTAAGAFLVEHAGGAVQRFTAIEGFVTPIQHESPDYDLLIAANNQRTLDHLGSVLLAAASS